MADTETAEAQAEAQPETQAEPEAQAQAEAQAEAQASSADAVEVQEADLPEAPAGTVPAATGQIEILLDTTLSIEVHLGQIQTQARELLHLGPGSVLQLDKQVGEPVELFLRGARFATGQLVVVGERLGVRVKEVLSSQPPAKADQGSAE